MEWLLLLGVVFITIVFGFRFFAFKSMTEKVCSLDPDNDYCRKHYKKNLDQSNDPYKKCDVIYGETPNGGVKTVICYLDDKNITTTKKDAVKVMVREFDENKRTVYETWTPLED
jgi:hypothetical protein